MNSLAPECFARLGLEPGVDRRAVQRAYARELKKFDPTEEPERFARLRQDYEQALALAARPAASEAFDTPPPPDIGGRKPPEPSPEPAPSLDEWPERASEPEDGERAGEPESPASSPVDPHPMPRVFLASLKGALALLPNDVHAVGQALRRELQSEHLVPLAAREALENLLVHALLEREFGRHNGALLLAAVEIFDWHAENRRHLERMGPAGARMSHALDVLSTMSSARTARLLALAEEPSPRTAVRLIKPGERLAVMAPLAALFFPPGHLERWMRARTQAPVSLRAGSSIWQLVRSPLMNVALTILVVVVALGIFSVVLSHIQGNEARKAVTECERAYARAAGAAWKNITFTEVTALSQCARQSPPQSCEDRAALLDTVAHAGRLIPKAGGYGWNFYDGMALNLDDGRSFGNTRAENCTTIMRFLRDADWLAEGDAMAARRLVESAARCYQRPETYAYSSIDPALRTFLSHTDAWPDPDASPQTQRFPLASFLGAPRHVDPMQLIAPTKPWAACATTSR